MTTKEKADEICKRHIFDSNHYDCCMEMAEWKERQMIEKACIWLALNADVFGFFNKTKQKQQEMVSEFVKAMEGGGR